MRTQKITQHQNHYSFLRCNIAPHVYFCLFQQNEGRKKMLKEKTCFLRRSQMTYLCSAYTSVFTLSSVNGKLDDQSGGEMGWIGMDGWRNSMRNKQNQFPLLIHIITFLCQKPSIIIIPLETLSTLMFTILTRIFTDMYQHSFADFLEIRNNGWRDNVRLHYIIGTLHFLQRMVNDEDR